MKIKFALLFIICIILSGCEHIMPAPSLPNITDEQAFKTLEKFHKGHGGKLNMKEKIADVTDGVKMAKLIVTDFYIETGGSGYKISAGRGFATFTQNPNKTWVLSSVTLEDMSGSYDFKPNIYVY